MIPKFLSPLTALCLLIGYPAHADQEPEPTPPEAVKGPEGASEQLSLEPAEVQKEIDTLAKSDLGQAIKEAIQEKLGAALKDLEVASERRERESYFREAIETAPAETAESERLLEALPNPEEASEIQFAGGVDDLRKQIEARRASLSTTESELADAEAELARVRSRPTIIGARLPAARNELADLSAKLPSLKPSGEPSLSRTADYQLALAQTISLDAEVDMLLQEQLSQASRENRRRAQRDLVDAQAKNEKAALRALDGLLKEQLANDTIRLQGRLTDLSASLTNPRPEVKSLLEELNGFSDQLGISTSELEQITHEREAVESKLGRISQDFARLREQVELSGLEGSFSHFVLEQRRELPNVRVVSHSIGLRQKSIADLRLANLSADEALRQQDGLEKKLSELSEPAIGKLLDLREEVLRTLVKNNRSNVQEAALLDSAERAYRDEISDFRTYLDSKLFWMKTSPPINPAFFTDLPGAFDWIADQYRSKEGTRAFISGLKAHRGAVVLILLAFAILIALRPATIKALKYRGHLTRRISTDKYRHTIFAFVYTLLLALPIPVLIATVSWVISHDPTGSIWVRGLSRGLFWTAFYIFAIELVRSICRKDGLGDLHFRWSQKKMKCLRRSFTSIIIVYLPATIVISTTLYDPSSKHFDSAGRLFFILSHLWIAYILFRAIRDLAGPMTESTDPDDPLFSPNGLVLHVVRFLAVGSPLFLVILAALGYLMGALRLSFALLGAIEICFLGSLLYSMVLRWFMIKERRLSAEQALEERRARREAAEAARSGDPAEAVEDGSDFNLISEDDVELDLDAIGTQTRRLLSSLTFVGVLIALWYFGGYIIPLEERANRLSFGGDFNLIVLLEAALTAWVGTIIVRNLPGLLELTGLRSTDMDAGTRYALVTIIQYVVTAIFAAIVFRFLDLDWSKFGWIAAALSVGLGFGLQEVVANFVCGIILLLERPIRVGDVVIIDGISGQVSRIRMRATTITNWDREDLVVPNKDFITGSLVNCTLSSTVNRVTLPVGIAYGSDIPGALRILEDIAASNPYVMEDPPPLAIFEQFGESSLDLSLRCYLPNRDNRLRATTELNCEIDARFKEAKIEIPFPQRDLRIKEQPDGSP